MLVYIGSNPVPVTYFGNHACLEQGVPWDSSNFRVTLHSILVSDMTNTLATVFNVFFRFFTISIRTPGKKNRITHFVTVPSCFWETKGNNKERKGAYLRG